jgi:D-alanine-D-alanine ligase
MKKINRHIEIVSSSESRLSSMSRDSREAIRATLAKHYTRVGITIVNNLADLEALVAARPDLVFLGMKFVPSDAKLSINDPNKIWLSDYLNQSGIAHTGSGQLAHELELNKQLAKQQVLEAGLRTARYQVIKQDQLCAPEMMTLKYPLFIKPTNRGGGLGVDNNSLVHNFEELKLKVEAITQLQSDSLIEEYLPGREFSVAILKDEYTAEFMVMPLELIAPADENGARILSGQVKSADTETFAEVTDESIKSKICELALDVFTALGARDYGRIDIRLDESGTPHFLEANLLPSLIKDYGNFPKACMLNIGMGYEPMLLSIVSLGLVRNLDHFEDFVQPITLTATTLATV